jgi:hypothetical protein
MEAWYAREEEGATTAVDKAELTYEAIASGISLVGERQRRPRSIAACFSVKR